MSFIVVEAIRWRCASFMSLPATVSEIFGGQTTPSILVVGPYIDVWFKRARWLHIFFTEGGRLGPGYPRRVIWCNRSSHLVAFPESRTHPTSSAALVNSTRARTFPGCIEVYYKCQCKIAVVKTIHDAIPQLTRAHNIIFPRCAGPLKRGARGMCHFCHIG